MNSVSGERTRLACSLRRPRRNVLEKVRDGEGAIASTRGACAPQKSAAVPAYIERRYLINTGLQTGAMKAQKAVSRFNGLPNEARLLGSY